MPELNEWRVNHDVDTIEPLIPKKQCGRPRKLRKSDPDESVRVTRKGYDVCCGNCGQKGHNARSFRQPENSNRKKYPKRVYSLFYIFIFF